MEGYKQTELKREREREIRAEGLGLTVRVQRFVLNVFTAAP